MEDPAVSNFRDYIRINTVQPSPDYAGATAWLKKQSEELGAEFYVVECVPGKPTVIISVPGKNPELPSILLNSHTDVVPVFKEHWTYDPFSAHKDEKGDIYGRGTQDMKCVGVQYLEAMKKLKKKNIKLLRTIHMSFVPDEEIGGVDGMMKFVKMSEFKNLNVGFALDEGYASPDETMFLFYGERCCWSFTIRCPGPPGHASQFISGSAAQKFNNVITALLTLRDEQEAKLAKDPSLTLGNVTTLNLTIVNGGVQFNVVPAELSAGFNVRLPPTADLRAFERTVRQICDKSGPGITIEYEQKEMCQVMSCVDDGKCPWWDAFRSSCDQQKIKLEKQIFPAATDSRYLREIGIPALGFSPMPSTPLLLHDHNEFLNERVFLKGIEIYENIIQSVANVPP